MKKYLFGFYLFFSVKLLNAQGVPYPLNNEAIYHQIDRFDILYGHNDSLYTSTKMYTRGDVVKFLTTLDSAKTLISYIDKTAKQYILDDNNELYNQYDFKIGVSDNQTNIPPLYKMNRKSRINYFYKTPANLFEIKTQFFNLKINPILNAKMAIERGEDQPIFFNQRGIELRGGVDDKLYFYSNILETQARFPNYVSNWIENHKAVPGNALFKSYESVYFKIKKGYDFLNAQGLICFNITKRLGVQLGNGQNVIGDGVRSLILSNFANNYFYLKLNTRIWKLKYQNIFAELIQDSGNSANNALVKKKYMALHKLDFNVNSHLNFGIFESTIMSRSDYFEIKYLNPIIFYHTLEQINGNSDNVLIGANFKWNVAKRFSFYGQTILDNFSLKESLFDKKGIWTNQYGTQIGIKYINSFNVDHLDTQLEFNKVRPFTYSFFDSKNSYTHASQNLAHPLGASFKEFLIRVRYQPKWKLLFDGRIIYADVGENSKTENWGNDPIFSNETRKQDIGYFTTGGVNAKILLLSLDASYQFYRNMFADIQILARKKDSQDPARNERTFYFGGGLRVNFGNIRNDF